MTHTMDPRVLQQLSQEEPGQFHDDLLAKCRTNLTASRKKMAEHYATWDMNDDVYHGRKTVDAEDVKAADRKEPVKMVAPLSYSQVQTFVAFCFGLFTQRERLFELIPVGPEFVKPAKIAEAFLHRDLNYSIWEARLYQYLLDAAKYGLAIVKTRWKKEFRTQLVAQQNPMGAVTYVNAPVPVFTGNQVINISPYLFFPDPKFPIARFQEGAFVATDEVMSRDELTWMESEQAVAGLQYVPPIAKRMLEGRGDCRAYGVNDLPPNSSAGVAGEDHNNVIITEYQTSLVPSKTMIADQPVGPEKFPVKYVIWIANDARIIKFEPLGYTHGQYTYDVGEYNPDLLNFANDSLQDPIHLLQDTISWLVNSRITNVRKIIGERIAADPSGVEISDLVERRPVIRMKPNAAKLGIDKYLKQLDMPDVTTNHIDDAMALRDVVQTVTGINENLMGEVSSGRRSATENRNAFSSAAGRVKMVAVLLYRTGLEPMGKKMLSNLRDGLDEQQIIRLVGMDEAVGAAGMFLRASKEDLVGEYDFEFFDGTLPSERVMNAQALGETMNLFIANPQAAIALQVDPRAIWLEFLELRGVRHPRRFLLPSTPVQMDPNANAQPQPQGPVGPGPAQGSPGLDFQSLLGGA